MAQKSCSYDNECEHNNTETTVNGVFYAGHIKVTEGGPTGPGTPMVEYIATYMGPTLKDQPLPSLKRRTHFKAYNSLGLSKNLAMSADKAKSQ
jgi:hypothetical protein